MKFVLASFFCLACFTGLARQTTLPDSVMVRVHNKGKYYLKKYAVDLDGHTYTFSDVWKGKYSGYQKLPFIRTLNHTDVTIVRKRLLNYDEWISQSEIPIDFIGEKTINKGKVCIEVFSKKKNGQLIVESKVVREDTQVAPKPDTTKKYPNRPASLGVIGDTADLKTPTRLGVVMMGGGKDVDAAFKWMINRSGGGDVVIIRASGTAAYNPYIYELGKVNSVETLKIDSRELADNDTVANIIRNAEMLFIAGGDQSNYMKYWRGIKTMAAINYLLNKKYVPVGGTSAGCAILGGFYYSGEIASLTADTALANPYHNLVKLYNNDFVHAPYLHDVITDQHYLTRSRQGRHVVFLARIAKDWHVSIKGIAADERTAVCMDEDGQAVVFGSSKAYFLLPDATKLPETLAPGKPLNWNHDQQALKVYEIQGSDTGAGHFDLAKFDLSKASGGNWLWWWVQDGVLHK